MTSAYVSWLPASNNFRGIEAHTAEYSVGRPDFITVMMSCQSNISMDFPLVKARDTSCLPDKNFSISCLTCWATTAEKAFRAAGPYVNRRRNAWPYCERLTDATTLVAV